MIEMMEDRINIIDNGERGEFYQSKGEGMDARNDLLDEWTCRR